MEEIFNSYTPTVRKVITLCGSTRFMESFHIVNSLLTRKGHVVLSVGHSVYDSPLTVEEKAALDKLHLDKIFASDEIFVVNVGGYIGDSTSVEIAFAMVNGKTIQFLEESLGNEFLRTNSHRLANLAAKFL